MKKAAFILLLLVPAVGAACGYLAGPFLARANDRVQLAALIWEEDSKSLTERTLESEAFRDTGRLRADLFAEARLIEWRFCVGAAFLGAWCGIVFGLKLFSLTRVSRQKVYAISQAQCVSCGRCFLACPRERMRLKNLALRSGRDTSAADSAVS